MIYQKRFSELSKNDAAIAGGKGASLGEMTGAGIPVPNGFVVLASTFDNFLELAGIDADIDAIISKVNHQEIHTVEQASKEIQAIILNSSIPKEIELEIKTEFKKLKSKYVAVRSSATAEDSSSAAWAGQLDSFLNTSEENLLENIKKCWASLFTPRAIFYRFEKELHNQKISVAVVVQKMVESEVSGIAFSVHPVTEDYNQIIIEAGFGLGEAIVSGQITPDSYVVTKDDFKILDRNVYTQERGIYRGKDNKSNDWINIENKKGSLQCLSDEQILELSKLIIRIENHYGFPCDIEWAMEGGDFYIVQSRPITTLIKNNEKLIDIKKFKETTKDRVYVSQQGDISIALLGNICNTIQDKYVSVYGYHHVRPILTLQKGSQGICYFDLEMYRDFSRVSYSKIKKSVYDLPEYKDYQEISKIIDSEYRNFFIPKNINEAKEKISYYFELAKKYLASTLFCEAVDHQIVSELVNNLEVKNVNEFIETSILPTKSSFVNHQNQLLLDDKDISWSFTNYFAAPDKTERLKLVEKKRSELVVKETKEEIEKNEKAAQLNQALVDSLIKKSSPEQKKLIEFIQISINMRDERKEFILKLFTILSDSLRYLAKELNISYDAISTIVDTEIDKLEGSLFLKTLTERSEKGVVMISYNDGPKVEVIDYDFVKNIIFDESIKGSNLEGICANKGKYVGIVRVIVSEKDFYQFKEGEILVTGMTRAEYVPLMRKAGAIITDEGGVTCHAAIISRELGKPCVINTRIATQVLKDGDEVEVDANNGLVIILKKVIEVKNIFDKFIDDYKIQAEGGRAVCYLLDHIIINQYLVENKTWPLIDINVFSSSIEHSAKWFRLHKGQSQYQEALDRFINKPQLVDELFTYLKSNRDETIKSLNEKEYSKLSNQELADFFGYIISCYYKVLRPSSIIRLIDLGLINKLKEMFADRDDPNKYLTVSTASEEKSFVLNEEIALLELALEVEEKKLDIENKYVLDKLANIFNEYCFSELGYYNEKIKTLDEYKHKLLEDVKSSPKERLAKINEDFKTFIEQRESLVKGLSINEKTVVDIASRLAHVKDVYKLSMNKVLYSSERLLSEIADRVGRSVDYIKDLSPDEIKSLLNGESVDEAYIAKRLASRVIIGFEKTLYVLIGEDTANFKNKYLEIDKSSNSYLGRCASSGHVSGKARIILGPKDFHKMIKGEILVVMNTSPDFTPIMKKAQAIIAEEGGLTAHVSIVSRELGIPSVVGVSHITEILKDGDEVEVDANNGIVKILKNRVDLIKNNNITSLAKGMFLMTSRPNSVQRSCLYCKHFQKNIYQPINKVVSLPISKTDDEWFFLKEDFEIFANNETEEFLKDDFLNEYIHRSKSYFDSWLVVCSNVNEIFSNGNKKEMSKVVKEYFDYPGLDNSYFYFSLSVWSFDQKVVPIYTEKLKQFWGELFSHNWEIITSQTELTGDQEMRLGLAELKKKFDDNIDDKIIKNFQEKYRYLGIYAPEDYGLTTEEIKKMYSEMNIEETLSILSYISKNRKAFRELKNKTKNKNILQMIDQINYNVYFRTIRSEKISYGCAQVSVMYEYLMNILNFSRQEVGNLTSKEIIKYFELGVIPPKRVDRPSMYFIDGEPNILTDEEKEKFRAIFESTEDIDSLSGSIAYKGKVKGKAKIITSINDLSKVEVGDVLISQFTRPEYLSAMQKAVAFVTNDGGITCHAAIVARELKKPCIIGTKIATKVIKDGDLIEVDANNGIIKIIERSK